MAAQVVPLLNKNFLPLVGEILAHGNSLRFKASGRSMLPVIKSGDIVEVGPLTNEIIIGDILLYRNSRSEAVVHRMIGRVRGENQVFFLVKGDSSSETDELVSEAQILGKVIDIHAKARVSFRKSLSIIFHKIQSLPLYARLAKAFIQTREGFTLEIKEAPGITYLSLMRQGRLIGSMELSKDIVYKDALIVSSLWVHWAYRRAGLGKRMMKEAFSYAHKERVREIRLFISKFNRAAMALYQKLGFVVVDTGTKSGYGLDFIQLKRDVENASCDTPEIWN